MNDANAPLSKPDPRAARFDMLLRLLDEDRDRAGEKYESVRRKLMKFFEWNSCFPPEDLVDETFERVEQRIGEVEMRDVIGFAWGVAKNVRHEAHKRAGRSVSISDLPGHESSLADTHDNEKSIHEKMEKERRIKCLHLCLQRLPKRDRELFLAYHTTDGEHVPYRQGLAERLGLTLGALRVKVNRLRNELEKCARRCFASWRINSRKVT